MEVTRLYTSVVNLFLAVVLGSLKGAIVGGNYIDRVPELCNIGNGLLESSGKLYIHGMEMPIDAEVVVAG